MSCYASTEFKKPLHAQWALFFTMLGIRWTYQPDSRVTFRISGNFFIGADVQVRSELNNGPSDALLSNQLSGPNGIYIIARGRPVDNVWTGPSLETGHHPWSMYVDVREGIDPTPVIQRAAVEAAGRFGSVPDAPKPGASLDAEALLALGPSELLAAMEPALREAFGKVVRAHAGADA